ncbi:MAG: hypothetical protein JWM37_141 [Candidatus Saccharibacteria bacterium]|nr:hypothetical protein [Candidatus Saccharibacteria bacterium]
MSSLAGTGQYPEWFNSEDIAPLRSIKPQLQSGEADASYISRYFDLYDKERELGRTITGREPHGRPLQQMIYNLGEDVVGRGFAAESPSGSLHTAMLTDIEKEGNTKQSSVLTPELNALKVAYGTDSLTDLLGVGGDEYSDKLRSALLQPNPIKWIRFNEQEAIRDMDVKWHQTQEAARKWMSSAIEVATGMPATEASDYVFSASRKNDAENTDIIDIINKINSFGVDRIRQLAAFSGIHGLEAYTTEQLERMEALAANPTEVAERLAQHDVTAVMINRFGDHNGVLRNVAANFDDSSKRTVFFEINGMDDIYRRMVTLRKAGVQPSTLILASHSAPGQFMVSDVREKANGQERHDIAMVAGRKLVAMANGSGDLDPGDYGYSMHGMKGMARLVETYMKPSQGIDDDSRDEGRKKIIFSACHAATEVKSGDIDDNGEKFQIGTESVISQLGKDLIASGVQSNVDIFGAPGGIQMHSTELGVHYSGQPTSFDEALVGRPRLAAERVRVEGGKLDKQEVEDIALRKVA